jgi:hypothetical protein
VHQILAEGLVLSAASEEVSQAVAMGEDNMVSVQAEIVAVSTDISTGSGVTFSVEGSNDLENWTTTTLSYSFEATTYQGPSMTYLPPYSNAPTIGFPFVRVRYKNDSSAEILLRVSMNTSKASA